MIYKPEGEGPNEYIRLHTVGKEIRKATRETYLGVAMTSNGISETLNYKRGEDPIRKAGMTACATRIGTKKH